VDYVLPADPEAPSRTHRHGNHLAAVLSSTGPWSTWGVVMTMMLAFGIAFELPLLIVMLNLRRDPLRRDPL
jgi:hypothetical protein